MDTNILCIVHTKGSSIYTDLIWSVRFSIINIFFKKFLSQVIVLHRIRDVIFSYTFSNPIRPTCSRCECEQKNLIRQTKLPKIMIYCQCQRVFHNLGCNVDLQICFSLFSVHHCRSEARVPTKQRRKRRFMAYDSVLNGRFSKAKKEKKFSVS